MRHSLWTRLRMTPASRHEGRASQTIRGDAARQALRVHRLPRRAREEGGQEKVTPLDWFCTGLMMGAITVRVFDWWRGKGWPS